MTEFRGARGSNTGDDFHELWATRHAIRLLSNDEDLQALAVEGLAARDETAAPEDTWDGVDCTLYFGGSDATAKHVVLEQLKYSAAAPDSAWTVARLTGGTRRDHSVIARLAKAWKGLTELRSNGSVPTVVLISNQPVDSEVISAFAHSAVTPMAARKTKPKENSAAEVRLAYASGLEPADFQKFSSAIRFEGGAGSRFALEEQVLRTIADWTDNDVQRVVTGLRQFVRQRMRPEFAGELITRESVMLHLGVSDGAALFPCPSEITQAEAPISRAPVREAIKKLRAGVQYMCLHGMGGVGKTTALQEIEADLPVGSIMIKYDCYGGGRYLDPSAFRHRSADAFLQLTNELSARLKLPLLVSRHHGSDYPKLFANRLRHAAKTVAVQQPDALLLIAIDAADNAITAAQSRVPAETPFVHDFVRLTEIPDNVRFIVTARSGRLPQLLLPTSYEKVPIKPFSLVETTENVSRVWSAPQPWIDDFHHLTNGVPRVQTYAFEVDGAHPSTALDRLRPAGKSLDEVFRQQFQAALSKSGNPAEVARLCAGLIALPRPVPLPDLAGVLGNTVAELTDVCADLAPGIRVHQEAVSFADEDFEEFVRREGFDQLKNIQQGAAAWLLARATHDQYAALNVAAALVSAHRGAELLDLVEREPAPTIVLDPVLRREAELQRLRLAITVCRQAHDVSRALRFVLIGAEGIKTETALRQMLVANPDMAVNYAEETAGRLILSDPEHVEDHGPFLFHKLAVDADRGDAISVREGRRLLTAWMQARKHQYLSTERHQHRRAWEISTSDISSLVEAMLKLDGPAAAIKTLGTWTPKRVWLEVALSLPARLIAEGHANDIEAVASDDQVGPIGKLLLLTPLALAGRSVDISLLAGGLEALIRRKLKLQHFFDGYQEGSSSHALVVDIALTACEILTSKRYAPELVDKVLDSFLLPKLRRIERRRAHEGAKLDFLFRAYALREVRAGRKPKTAGIFEPRPELTDSRKRREIASDVNRRERPLMELADAVFGIYIAIANGLVHRKTSAELNELLSHAVRTLKQETWRISRQHGTEKLRWSAAKSLLVLRVAEYDPHELMRYATDVHGQWGNGHEVPNEQFLMRLSLNQELHISLLQDLAAVAAETRKLRISADQKSSMLVSYARAIKLISPDDANAVFNDAVEAASELDREGMAQIRLLDKLSVRGTGAFPDHRGTAKHVSDVIADAAIRLDGYDHFPWDESMSLLTRLDAPLALASAARWDDEMGTQLHNSLPPLLKMALQSGALNPAQGAAIALFVDRDEGLLAEVLEQASTTKLPSLPALAEAAAYDALIRYGQNSRDSIKGFIEQRDLKGRWTGALRRQEHFLSNAFSEEKKGGNDELMLQANAENPLNQHNWDRDTLLDSVRLQAVSRALHEQGRAERTYLSISAILRSAQLAVRPRDRISYLSTLVKLDDEFFINETTEALLEAIEAWNGPAVKSWCRTNLPEVIVKRLPALWYSFQYRKDRLTPTLEKTELSANERQDLILDGIARHVDNFGSESIFALAGLVGGELPSSEAAVLAAWYAERLANRIPVEERDRVPKDSALPSDTNEAVARFIFAYMGDFDVRNRWRAAHAVRRLACAGDKSTLEYLIAQYGRRDEVAFREPQLNFYWLAARLWFVIAWDRVAAEHPEIASLAGPALLQIALDDSFPHLLVRSFARDACKKLEASGCLFLSQNEKISLERVNKTQVDRVHAAESTRRHFSHKDEKRRFKFDSMDTLPYWYEPLLRSFANLDGDRFLEAVEHWIIDVWGYSGDVRDFDKEPRRERLNRDWSLSSTRQGSTPTLERLNHHLEWHGMWCAVGELLKTEPLTPRDDDNWDDFGARVRRQKLSEPPLWSADLIVPIPLVARNFQADKRALHEWALGVEELDHRAELFPDDQPEYLVVDSHAERRSGDRIEVINVASALAAPKTGGALLRTLQTMEDTWDYKLPDEDEDIEIDQEPFRLLGWLCSSHRDNGIDEKDPFRGYASTIQSVPGRRVSQACGLTRDVTSGARWHTKVTKPPMFIYEVWGEHDRDNERYSADLKVAGRRLLVHKEQLQEFLGGQALDLIIEVEVTRRERETRQYDSDEEIENAEGRFDRLYRLRADGGLDVAEGYLGTWAGDCPGARIR